MCVRKKPAQKMARALIPPSDTTSNPFRWILLPSAAFLRSSCILVCLARPPLALRRLVGSRCRPKPGAEASVGLSAGHEHAPGAPTLPLPFTLREAERRNPNLKVFSYLIDKPPSFEVFAKIIGYLYWIRPWLRGYLWIAAVVSLIV
jgi:hypothetical protein